MVLFLCAPEYVFKNYKAKHGKLISWKNNNIQTCVRTCCKEIFDSRIVNSMLHLFSASKVAKSSNPFQMLERYSSAKQASIG